MSKRKGRPPRLRLPATPLPAEAVTKAAFARLLGCAPARITEWCRRGILAAPALTPDGRLVPALAAAALVAAGAVLPASAAQQAAPPTGQPGGFDASRARREAARAELDELLVAERRSELVTRAMADSVLFDAARALRDAWQGWPARVAATMAAKLGVDAAALLAELDRGVRQQLAEVADPAADWRTRAKAGRPA